MEGLNVYVALNVDVRLMVGVGVKVCTEWAQDGTRTSIMASMGI